MDQLVKLMPCKHEASSSKPQHLCKEPGMGQIFVILVTGEGEADGSQVLTGQPA